MDSVTKEEQETPPPVACDEEDVIPDENLPLNSVPPPSSNSSTLDRNQQILCGWLYKSAPRNRRMKLRWFVYDCERTALVYYRSPQDHANLGEIDISCSAFLSSFNPDPLSGFYYFDISTTNKHHRLLHEHENTIIYWRQALQRRRLQAQNRRIQQARLLSSNLFKVYGLECTSLLSIYSAPTNEPLVAENFEETAEEIKPITEDIIPESMAQVGLQTMNSRAAGLGEISFKNIGVEAKNIMRKLSTPSTTNAESNFFDYESSSSGCIVSGKRELLHSLDDIVESPTVNQKQAATSYSRNPFNRQQSLNDQTSPVMSLFQALKVPGNSKSGSKSPTKETAPEIKSELQPPAKELNSKSIGLFKKRPSYHETSASTCLKCAQQGAKLEDMRQTVHALELQLESYKVLVRRYAFFASEENLEQPKDADLAQTKKWLEKALVEREEFQKEVEILQETLLAKDKLLMQSVLEGDEKGEESLFHLKEMIDSLKVKVKQQEMDQAKLNQENQLLRAELVQLKQSLEMSRNIELHLTNTIKKFYEHCPSSDNYPQFDIYHFNIPSISDTSNIRSTLISMNIDPDFYLASGEQPEIQQKRIEEWMKLQPIYREGKAAKLPQNLKPLIREGIPSKELRINFWRGRVELFKQRFADADSLYQTLLDAARSRGVSPQSKQIEIDLPRVMPENRRFDLRQADNLAPSLKNILLAFAENANNIGYCQGIDRIAAIFLLHFEYDESLSFWALNYFITSLPNDYYTSQLLDSITDQRVLKDLLKERLPKLYSHLDCIQVDMSLFTFSWFLTLFVDGFHWKLYLKIWDAFFEEGDKILFRYCLAILNYLQPILLSCNDRAAVMNILRNAGSLCHNHEKITQMAFNDIDSFPKKRICQKRAQYRVQVMEEFQTLDMIRRARTKSNFSFEYTMESDDDVDSAVYIKVDKKSQNPVTKEEDDIELHESKSDEQLTSDPIVIVESCSVPQSIKRDSSLEETSIDDNQ